MNEIRTVNFYGDEVMVMRHEDGRIFVPMRRVCEAIGLSWGAQYTKLQSEEWREGVSQIETANTSNHLTGEICLNIEFLPMYLAQIRLGKVREDIRPKLLRYKSEARRALADAFLRGNTTAPSSDKFQDHPMMMMMKHQQALTINYLEQQEQINQLENKNRQLENKNIELSGKVEVVDQTIDNLITHRKGGDPVPAGTLTLPNIKTKYFFGVSQAIVSEWLDEMKHPKVPYTYVVRAFEQHSFCYQENGLADLYLKLITSSTFRNPAPTRYMFTNPYIKNAFAFQRDQLPSWVVDMIHSKINSDEEVRVSHDRM